jgi:hypothetical protein
MSDLKIRREELKLYRKAFLKCGLRHTSEQTKDRKEDIALTCNY